MKSYPSIPRTFGSSKIREFDAHLFDKVDGSNLRFEWDRKKGWYKFGTRRRLLYPSTPIFGMAIELFHDTLAEPIAKIAIDHKWPRLLLFAEFWGKHSFAGQHDPDDQKLLTPIDLSIYKKGFVPPEEFVRLFDEVTDLGYLGTTRWNKEYVQWVREGLVEGITFEGVVGKAGGGHKRIMAKAKTQAWIDKVIEFFGHEKGLKIVNS